MQPPERDAPRLRVEPMPWGTRVTLCAPDVRNALDPRTLSMLHEVFTADAPGAVLLRAEGPVFCAGGDLGVLAAAAADGSLPQLLSEAAGVFASVVQAVVASPRPVVAALGGPAVGGGASLALACDVRVAAPDARLVLGWGRWGLPPDGGATALLAAAVGAASARSLLMQEADLGTDHPLAPLMFQQLVAADQLDDEAAAVATALGESAGARAAKAATRDLLLPTLRSQCDREIEGLAAAAADTVIARRLSMLYKMNR